MKAPGFGENRKSGLQDLAVLTGGSVSFSFDIITLSSTLSSSSICVTVVTDT